MDGSGGRLDAGGKSKSPDCDVKSERAEKKKMKKSYHAEGSERPGHEPGIKQWVKGAAAGEWPPTKHKCTITRTKQIAHWVAIP